MAEEAIGPMAREVIAHKDEQIRDLKAAIVTLEAVVLNAVGRLALDCEALREAAYAANKISDPRPK